MLSINTNLQSLIVQNNLTKSTTGLNQAIERMTTGFKLNHASDNAAGYSITQNMTSKLNSYEVARDNISAGLDLLATTQDTISLMQSHGQRIHALITQAQNGTYGAQSLDAINSEIGARIAEINRLYMNTEYNGIGLFDVLPDGAQEIIANAGKKAADAPDGFLAAIETVTPDVVVTEASALASAISSNSTIGIANADVLAELATLVNNGTTCSGKTIVLTEDIDLSAYSTGEGWTPIGGYIADPEYEEPAVFEGTFDGQGHRITNLKINCTDSIGYSGLFGYTSGELKNVGIVDADIISNVCNEVGSLAGYSGGTITNCYATGSVTGNESFAGGLAGYGYIISHSYAAVEVKGNMAGGLVGMTGYVTNCYATGNVTGVEQVGGLVGEAGARKSLIIDSYATGTVTGYSTVGGIAGYLRGTITNCYYDGNIAGDHSVGGLVGSIDQRNTIQNCVQMGNIYGEEDVGGLVGHMVLYNKIKNCIQAGNVSGTSKVGTLIGSTNPYVNPDDIENLLNKSNQELAFEYTRVSTMEEFIDLIEDAGGIEVVCESYGISATYEELINALAEERRSYYGLVTDCKTNENSNLEMVGSGVTLIQNLTTIKSGFSLQVGINGDSSSSITFDTSLNCDLSSILTKGAQDSSCYNVINTFLDDLSRKATELGAVSNRLESALDSTGVAIENLTSSRSTLRDADVAKESSAYIKYQILQQAAATLLATANQTPSIALQLL